MEIGNKIKLMRLKCSLTQEELADRCELSKGFISQLENDLTNPSISTLEDITLALGTTLKQLFTDEQTEKVVFTEEDYFKKETEQSVQTWLVTNSSKNEIEPILVKLFPQQSTDDDMPHEGEEFGYVLEGNIVLILGKETFDLKKGDSFYFKADKVHKIRNKCQDDALFIWISSPPNF